MTTKSPTSTCGAYWGLCFPRSSCAVWLASRPSTTSVASMTCQARLTSPGLGVYVRTALVSSVVVGKAGGIASPSTGDGAARADTSRPARQPTTIPVDGPRPPPPSQARGEPLDGAEDEVSGPFTQSASAPRSAPRSFLAAMLPRLSADPSHSPLPRPGPLLARSSLRCSRGCQRTLHTVRF